MIRRLLTEWAGYVGCEIHLLFNTFPRFHSEAPIGNLLSKLDYAESYLALIFDLMLSKVRSQILGNLRSLTTIFHKSSLCKRLVTPLVCSIPERLLE